MKKESLILIRSMLLMGKVESMVEGLAFRTNEVLKHGKVHLQNFNSHMNMP